MVLKDVIIRVDEMVRWNLVAGNIKSPFVKGGFRGNVRIAGRTSRYEKKEKPKWFSKM